MNRSTILKELQFKAVRSGGPGGQHANKVSSKVEVAFAIENSSGLTEIEKQRLLEKLKNKINKSGELILFCEESRSQHTNKTLAIEKLFELLKNNLAVPKERKPTKPSKAKKEKRLKAKKMQTVKKALRTKPKLD